MKYNIIFEYKGINKENYVNKLIDLSQIIIVNI